MKQYTIVYLGFILLWRYRNTGIVLNTYVESRFLASEPRLETTIGAKAAFGT